jgi:hypothetical protein
VIRRANQFIPVALYLNAPYGEVQTRSAPVPPASAGGTGAERVCVLSFGFWVLRFEFESAPLDLNVKHKMQNAKLKTARKRKLELSLARE